MKECSTLYVISHSHLWGIFLTQGLNPVLQMDSLTSEPQGKPHMSLGKWKLKKIVRYHDVPIVVQLLSCVWLFSAPWTVAHQACLCFAISWSLLQLMSIESIMPSSHLILCRPLLLLLSIFPSIRAFSSELILRIWWPKYQGFSFSISPSNEYLGLISFRIDGFDLLAVQGTIYGKLQNFK